MATSETDRQDEKSIIKLFHDGKSGLEGLDSDLINRTINDVTRGSNFYNHKLAREKKIESRVKRMKEQIEDCTFIERENARKTIEQLRNENQIIGKDLSHVIVHVDMDMYFVAVEIRDNPSLADKPVAVGSSSMISTSNYVARKYGVRAGMPGFIGLKLCPQLQLIPGRYNKYREESQKIAEVMKEYDETFVPSSLDECSIDLTDYLVKRCSLPDAKIEVEIKKTALGEHILEDKVWQLAEQIVQELRQKVFEKTQLTCSAGIAPNKMLAKMCSDINKPNNQYILKGTSSEDLVKFIRKFNVKKIPGIGPVQQQTLKGFDIETVEQLSSSLEKLCLVYSPLQIEYFTRISLGISSFEMNTDEPAKSESREETFKATNDQEFLRQTLKELCETLCSSLVRNNYKGKTITLKIKKESFQVNVRSKTISDYVNDIDTIFEIGYRLLLKEMSQQDFKVRLIGIRLSNFQDDNEEKNQQARIDDLFKRKLEKARESSSTSSNNDFEYSQELIENNDQVDGLENTDSSEKQSPDQSNRQENQFDEDTLSYLCPVCSVRRFSRLDELNQHVDYCLSREKIMSSVQEFNNSTLTTHDSGEQEVSSTTSSGKKRPKPSSSRAVDKHSPKKKKITEYFNRR